MSKTGVGLIGCGGRLRGVMREVLRATGDVEVVALQDPNPHSIAAARSEFGSDAREYEDYHALVADPRVEWVLIGSWNCYHAEQVLAAFAAGKHVFCEKPLALSLKDCLSMREAWKASGRMFTIGFTLRYSPHYQCVRRIIEEGRLGRILSLEFNETLDFNHGGYIHADWRRKTSWAGSHLLEKCCHDLDIVNWLTDSYCVKAASFGGNDFFTAANAGESGRVGTDAEGRAAFATWSHSTILGNVVNPFNDDKDIVDNQVAILQFAAGMRATFHTNCSTGIPERRLYLCGTEGTLRADIISGSLELKRIGFGTQLEDLRSGVSGGHGGGDEHLGACLAASMRSGAEPVTSIEDGLRAAVTAFGVDEALRTGQVVDLMPMWKRAGL